MTIPLEGVITCIIVTLVLFALVILFAITVQRRDNEIRKLNTESLDRRLELQAQLHSANGSLKGLQAAHAYEEQLMKAAREEIERLRNEKSMHEIEIRHLRRRIDNMRRWAAQWRERHVKEKQELRTEIRRLKDAALQSATVSVPAQSPDHLRVQRLERCFITLAKLAGIHRKYDESTPDEKRFNLSQLLTDLESVYEETAIEDEKLQRDVRLGRLLKADKDVD